MFKHLKLLASVLLSFLVVFTSARAFAITDLASLPTEIGKYQNVKFYGCRKPANDIYGGTLVKIDAIGLNETSVVNTIKKYNSIRLKSYYSSGSVYRTYTPSLFWLVNFKKYSLWIAESLDYVPYNGYFQVRLYDTRTRTYGPVPYVSANSYILNTYKISPKYLVKCR